MGDWIRDPRCNASPHAIIYRLRRGIPPEDAISLEKITGVEPQKLHLAFGEEKTFQDWADDPRCLPSRSTLKSRVYYGGWSMQEALTTPVKNLYQNRREEYFQLRMKLRFSTREMSCALGIQTKEWNRVEIHKHEPKCYVKRGIETIRFLIECLQTEEEIRDLAYILRQDGLAVAIQHVYRIGITKALSKHDSPTPNEPLVKFGEDQHSDHWAFAG